MSTEKCIFLPIQFQVKKHFRSKHSKINSQKEDKRATQTTFKTTHLQLNQRTGRLYEEKKDVTRAEKVCFKDDKDSI